MDDYEQYLYGDSPVYGGASKPKVVTNTGNNPGNVNVVSYYGGGSAATISSNTGNNPGNPNARGYHGDGDGDGEERDSHLSSNLGRSNSRPTDVGSDWRIEGIDLREVNKADSSFYGIEGYFDFQSKVAQYISGAAEAAAESMKGLETKYVISQFEKIGSDFSRIGLVSDFLSFAASENKVAKAQELAVTYGTETVVEKILTRIGIESAALPAIAAEGAINVVAFLADAGNPSEDVVARQHQIEEILNVPTGLSSYDQAQSKIALDYWIACVNAMAMNVGWYIEDTPCVPTVPTFPLTGVGKMTDPHRPAAGYPDPSDPNLPDGSVFLEFNGNLYPYHPNNPVLLDLNGNGIEVLDLSRSTRFMTGEDGLQHRSAWAGAGDGVLFFDLGGDGKITDQREYVFTEWASGAKDDRTALRQVFDSNGDGKLTAADAVAGVLAACAGCARAAVPSPLQV
jgi:hypothetical protein